MKSNKSIDKTTKLIENINTQIFETIDKLPKELINHYIGEISSLKTDLTKIIIEELYKANLFEYKTKKNEYLRKENDLKRLIENKKMIKKMITENKKISIAELAKNLNITRQALYKNKELKNLIDELKKVVN